MAHKTELRVILKKICRQKLRSEERITCAKFHKNGDKKYKSWSRVFWNRGVYSEKLTWNNRNFWNSWKIFDFDAPNIVISAKGQFAEVVAYNTLGS